MRGRRRISSSRRARRLSSQRKLRTSTTTSQKESWKYIARRGFRRNRLAHHGPLRPARCIFAVERHRADDYAAISVEGSLTRIGYSTYADLAFFGTGNKNTFRRFVF